MDFIAGLIVGFVVLAAVAIAAYVVLRRLFERASNRVADDIGRVLAELSTRATATPAGQQAAAAARAAARLSHLGAYAAAGGMSEDAARREFAQSIERIARLMDSAVRIPIVGPVGLDSALGLFPVAGDAASAAVSVLIIAQSEIRRAAGHHHEDARQRPARSPAWRAANRRRSRRYVVPRQRTQRSAVESSFAILTTQEPQPDGPRILRQDPVKGVQ